MASTLCRIGRLRNSLHSRGFSQTFPKWGRGISTEELSDVDESVINGDKTGNNRVAGFQGVYKAVILGEVTQPPSETVLRSGKSITNLLVSTGGMRVARKNSDAPIKPIKQIHKVVVYQDRFRDLVMQKVKKGAQVYLEGNMESRVFNDPVTGAVKVVREIAVRQNGRLFLVDDLELRGGNNSKSNIKGKQVELGEDHDAEEIVVRS